MKISQLKKDLHNGNIDSSLNYLSSTINTFVFREFKEHKLLLISLDKKKLIEVRDAYKKTINRLIPNNQLVEIELNYLDFIDLYLIATNELEGQLKMLLVDQLNLNLKSFSILIFNQVDLYNFSLQEHLYENVFGQSPSNIAPDQLSEFHSWCFNILRGRLNDMMFAATNLINLFSGWQNQDTPMRDIGTNEIQEKDELRDALIISGIINSYNYALDKITYGEWAISDFSICNDKPKITFSIIDERLEKARDLALKRITSDKLFVEKKNQRWLRDLMIDFVSEAFDQAWDYYQNIGNIYLINNDEYKKAKEHIIKSLDGLDAEDELLVGMNHDDLEVASAYIVGCILACYCTAASFLKNKSKGHLYTYTFPEIPYNQIKRQIDRTFLQGKPIINCLDLFICELPINQHLDLFKTPFIRDRDGKIYAVDNLSEDWTKWAKWFLMKGGKAADIVGKSWEGYIANILKENHWQKVIQGVKIKKSGKLITDIDILAKRENLLLIVQMKVHYGTGINSFEQWKFRNKLQHGVEQTKIAKKSIDEDIGILAHHFTKKEIDEITKIQSVVITNSHIYNGWKYLEVPIMSTGSLMQIINGASVKFGSTDGKLASVKKYATSDIVSVDEFIAFLELPLDWRIGDPEYQIKYHEEKLDHATLIFPLLANKDGENSIDLFTE